jgi:polyhydroxybutyrate depolymerase
VTLALILLLILLLALVMRRRRRLGRRRWRRLSGAQTINIGGEERSYALHRPRGWNGGARPLLICFHGGSGIAERFAQGSGLIEAGERHGFAVAFPEAPEGWEDARPERGGGRRDLDFVEALVEKLAAEPGIDARRIYALGASNGGMFVMRLACERPERFAGFATVIANLPAAQSEMARPGHPVPIALVFGQEDRVMPRGGGRILQARGVGVGGMVLSAEATVSFWVKRNQAGRAPRSASLQAGQRIEVRDFPAGPGGAPVRVVEIEGWRHKWPRWGANRLRGQPGFDVADLIWDFFTGEAVGSRAESWPPKQMQAELGR